MGFTAIGRAGRIFALGIDGRHPGFDDMLFSVVGDLRELHFGMTHNATFRHPSDSKMCVALGGWSSARQLYEAYRIMSYDKESTLAPTACPP